MRHSSFAALLGAVLVLAGARAAEAAEAVTVAALRFVSSGPVFIAKE